MHKTLTEEDSFLAGSFYLLDLTIEAMKIEKLVDCFYDFGIFPEPVSFDALKIIWGTNKFITANYLEQLFQKSLIKKHTINQARTDITNQLFTVHDLTASYLMKKLKENKTTKMCTDI